uniref:Variant surface glycoprotein 1125.67 n=1 Tax=Trypanosoma brucei TaxID=5691 RepID=A0A1J0R574_9TRYP|nr:variant surface glycoprotein 1125.67 [Trypanosoma brucei]
MIKQIIISAILVLLVTNKGNAAVAAGDNAATAGALCQILALAGGRSSIGQPDSAGDDAHHEILDLNMSLAGESWRSVFEEPGKKGTYPAEKPAQYKSNTDWDAKWSEWSETAQRLKDEKTMQAKLKDSKLDTRTPQQMAVAKATILQLAAEQSKLAAELARLKSENKVLTTAQLKTKLNTAIYGEDVATEATLTPEKVFGSPAGDKREEKCDGTAKDNKAKTVMAALVCICAKDNTDGLATACAPHITLSQTWTSSKLPDNNIMQEIRKLCPKSKTALLTTDRLKQLISAVKSHLTGSSAGMTLGKLAGGSDCSGSSGSGLCVKYTDIHDEGSATADGINWIAALTTIATELAEHEKTVAAINSITRQLTTNSDKAKDFIAKLEQYTQAQAAILATMPQSPAQTQENHQNAKNACAQYASNSTCTEKGCKWDSTDKTEGAFCKPKDGDGQTNPAGTGTEGGAAGEQKKEEKCKGKSQTDCKDGCKWEGTECKDSSILATKKFALSMVSAAFVALLF